MLKIKDIFNWVVMPLIIIALATMMISKMCNTVSSLGTEISKLSTTLETIKKNNADMTAGIPGVSSVISSSNTNFNSDSQVWANPSKPSRHGEWVFSTPSKQLK